MYLICYYYVELKFISQYQIVMNTIDPDRKVADLVEQHPQTWEVFRSYGCPDMRKGFFSLMARIMSIRNAARIHRIPLNELISDLKAVIANTKTLTDNE